jgi:hypothetical protein
METCVVYAPQDPELLKEEHWEVWSGLPVEYKFCDVTTADGRTALAAEGQNYHISVTPEAKAAYNENNMGLLMALGSRKEKSVEFNVYVHKQERTFKFLVPHAKKLNEDIRKQLEEIKKEQQLEVEGDH